MALEEFENVKCTRESRVVLVFHHKLLGVRGPTDIVLTSSLNKEANIYSFNFCNKLEGFGLEKQNSFLLVTVERKCPHQW